MKEYINILDSTVVKNDSITNNIFKHRRKIQGNEPPREDLDTDGFNSIGLNGLLTEESYKTKQMEHLIPPTHVFYALLITLP